MSQVGPNRMDLASEIRRNRERLGLSHARVAELVGRPPSTVRSWERGETRPEDPEVLRSLAAVLAMKESDVFSAAGVRPPDVREKASVEAALGSLKGETEDVDDAPVRDILSYPADPSPGPDSIAVDPEHIEIEASAEDISSATRRGAHVREPAKPVPSISDTVTPIVGRLKSIAERSQARRAAKGTTNVPARALSTLPQRPPNPSYIENESERLAYRFRALLTTAGIAVVLIVMAWAASNLLEALGETWSTLTSNL